MKTKFTYLLLVIIAMTISFTFTSCGDDDDDVTPGNSSIVGVWEVGDQLINGHPGTLRVEFNSNNKGVISGIYTDGTDPDSYNFEYVIKKEQNGDTFLTIIWTGTHNLIYQENREYEVTIAPTRLVWGNFTYVRK